MDICSKCHIKTIWNPHGEGHQILCLDCKLWNYKYQGKDRTRELVRIRDNQTCRDCGKLWQDGQRKFDVHHLNGLCGKKTHNYDKLSEMVGLITLCHKCHYNRTDHAMRVKVMHRKSIPALNSVL